jgi:tripartite-type tricarboxylate transporter receptor subunit TctC
MGLREIAASAGLALAVSFAGAASAQEYPSKPITIISPWEPGSSVTLLQRVVAKEMEKILGQPIIVEPRPGATGAIGIGAAIKAPADGYTLVTTVTSSFVSPLVNKQIKFDMFKDLTPVGQMGSIEWVIIGRPDLDVSDLKGVIAKAKAKPGTVTYGSSGIGSALHIAMAALTAEAGITLRHVPYKGEATGIVGVMGKEVDLGITTLAGSAPKIRSGEVKGIAVTSRNRSPYLPDLPTASESGVPGFSVESFNGIHAPAGTPDAVLAKLESALLKAMESPDVIEYTKKASFLRDPKPRKEYGERIQKLIDSFKPLVEKMDIAPK